MTQRDNILQELNELGSSLVSTSSSNTYRIPGNYFETLAEQVMARIRAMEAVSTQEELTGSPLLNTGRITPYQVPADYFHGLEEKLMQGVLQSDSNLEPAEELESLSPFLSGLKKQVPYRVPDNYFETLNDDNGNKSSRGETKVISLTARKWLRYAAAAIVVGFVSLSGFLYLNRTERIDPTVKSHEWVEKNMKKVSTDDLNKFIDLTDEEAPVIASASNTEEVKELVKNVSADAIQDFLNDAQVAEPDLNEDQSLN
jgi:hypothetical protein